MLKTSFTLLISSAALALAGCGEDYRYETENPDTPEVVYAEEVRTGLQDMKDSLETEGVAGVEGVIEGYMESIEGYEEPPVGEHAATYKKIDEGVKEIQQMVENNGSRAEISAKLEELIALTDSLPKPKNTDAGAEAE